MIAAIAVEQAAQPLQQPGPAAIAAALLASRLAFPYALRLALMDAGRLALVSASRFAGRFAAVTMKQSPEFFQEPVAATTPAVAATRIRGGRRVGLDRWRGRLIGACEPGCRHQQERSIHKKFLRLGTQPRLRAAAALAGDFLRWNVRRSAPSVWDAVSLFPAAWVFFPADLIC